MTEATKKVTLTIGERFALLKPQGGLLNEYKGTTDGLAFVLEDAKVLSITEADWKAANLVKTPIMEGDKQVGESLKWDDVGSDKEVELSGYTVEWVLAQIKAKDDKGEITIADHVLITLKQKLS